MTAWLGFIYSVLKAIPVLDKAARAFFIYYSELEKDWTYAAIAKANVTAIESGDQRELEKAIGSPKAGKPSGHDGVEYGDP